MMEFIARNATNGKKVEFLRVGDSYRAEWVNGFEDHFAWYDVDIVHRWLEDGTLDLVEIIQDGRHY